MQSKRKLAQIAKKRKADNYTHTLSVFLLLNLTSPGRDPTSPDPNDHTPQTQTFVNADPTKPNPKTETRSKTHCRAPRTYPKSSKTTHRTANRALRASQPRATIPGNLLPLIKRSANRLRTSFSPVNPFLCGGG